jgi:hypothetical protein
VRADEQITAAAVWREALAIIRRYPLAMVVPAAMLGALGEAPYYFIEGWLNVSEGVITSLTGAIAFYLYMTLIEQMEIMSIYTAYAEEVAVDAERGSRRITMRSALHKMRQAAPVVPSIIIAAVAAITIPIAAVTLLVIPGLWLLTRWSLFAPAIVRERLGPVAALKRSSGLVRSHFELVFLTAALAIVLEEAGIHAGGVAGLIVTGSDTWGQWIGGWIATSLITPLAALATSVAYSCVWRSG